MECGIERAPGKNEGNEPLKVAAAAVLSSLPEIEKAGRQGQEGQKAAGGMSEEWTRGIGKTFEILAPKSTAKTEGLRSSNFWLYMLR